MSDEEKKHREDLLSSNFETRVDAAVALTELFLLERNDLEESEVVLLDVLGLQSPSAGYVIELTLGRVYIKMDELPRAKRFLLTAQTSKDEVIAREATEFLEFIENSSK